MFIIYTPPLHPAFSKYFQYTLERYHLTSLKDGSYHTSPLYWLIPVGFGVLLLIWASIRVVILKNALTNSLVKDIQGLQMCKLSIYIFLNFCSRFV